MANSDGLDRGTITIYVPTYQKENWREHADGLGMNQSEFVKSMVQAGRHGFDPPENPDEPSFADATPGVGDLERAVLDALGEGSRSWDELVASLTDDLEDELETTLQRLQRENRVRYSGRQGGYAATEGDGD